MRQEFEALKTNQTSKIVELPIGKKPIGSKWVYKIKYKADGSVERYKARLVVRGDIQVEGTDFNETFSPVFKIKGLGLLNYIFGIEVFYHKSGVLLHQKKFISDLLLEYNCLDASEVVSPLDIAHKLHSDVCELLPKPETYRSLVG
nr:uncharacterized mitochondrial protein AtMg00820-like [Nicotiana tomentosiformis]